MQPYGESSGCGGGEYGSGKLLYLGLRIGLSIYRKGLAYSLDVPLIGVWTHRKILAVKAMFRKYRLARG